MENLLKYQKFDEQLYKIEQKMSNGAYKKKAEALRVQAENSKRISEKLKEDAEHLLTEIEEIKSKHKLNKTKAEEILGKDIEGLSMGELEKISVLKSKIFSNLNILEKVLQKAAERINRIVTEYQKTKDIYEKIRNDYNVCKKKITEEDSVLVPEKEKLVKELAELGKSVQQELLAEYKKKRNDKIFPVFVPLESGAFCGHCRMEQPKAAISKLKEQPFITCEHCKRYIYNKK
ncbi:MAG: hypothetical protein J6J24_04325 [Clostridia bacterium]|nr:hypothetical protein [Clostridia bacterium]